MGDSGDGGDGSFGMPPADCRNCHPYPLHDGHDDGDGVFGILPRKSCNRHAAVLLSEAARRRIASGFTERLNGLETLCTGHEAGKISGHADYAKPSEFLRKSVGSRFFQQGRSEKTAAAATEKEKITCLLWKSRFREKIETALPNSIIGIRQGGFGCRCNVIYAKIVFCAADTMMSAQRGMPSAPLFRQSV